MLDGILSGMLGAALEKADDPRLATIFRKHREGADVVGELRAIRKTHNDPAIGASVYTACVASALVDFINGRYDHCISELAFADERLRPLNRYDYWDMWAEVANEIATVAALPYHYDPVYHP